MDNLLFSYLLSYVTLGVFIGLLAGLLGVGGGLVIVPALVFLFQQQGMDPAIIVHLAIGTSLATIIATSWSSVRAHHRRGAVLWLVVQQFTPGIILGTGMGAALVHELPAGMLKILFGLFELAVAVKMGFGIRPSPKRTLPGPIAMNGMGQVIGFVSAIVGIGGGTITVPFLVWCNVALRNAVATSAACGVPIAIFGTISFLITGWSTMGLPSHSTGYLYWPAVAGISAASVFTAPLGAKLAHTLPTQSLEKIFAGFLFFLGIRMLWTA